MPRKNFLLDTLLKALDDMQANDVKVLDVSRQTTITDYMIICSGRSSRHVKAIAEHLLEQLKASGHPALSQSGLDSGDWALIDFADFVVHVMQPESREFYNLEGLWQDKPQ
jgi:ribosome-associated protein